MQTRASKEFNVNAICVDVGLSCGEAAQVPGCMKRRREEEKKRRREEEKKRGREEDKIRCPFCVFPWLGFMVFWRPSKSNQKTFRKHFNFEHFDAFVAQVPFWCFFVAGLHGFLEAFKK
jgi:hypothetical protein